MGDPECSRVEAPTEVPPLRVTCRDLTALKEQIVQRGFHRDRSVKIGFEGISSGEEEAVKPLRASFDLRQKQIGSEWIEDEVGAQPRISKCLSIEVESLPDTPTHIVAEKTVEDFTVDSDPKIGAFREPGGKSRPGEGKFIAIDRSFDPDGETLETYGEIEIAQKSRGEPSFSQSISRLSAIEIGDDAEPRPIECFPLQSQFHSLGANLRVTAISTVVIECGEFDLTAEVKTRNTIWAVESQPIKGVETQPAGGLLQRARIGIDPILIPFIEERIIGGDLIVADGVEVQECRSWAGIRGEDLLRSRRLETGDDRRQCGEKSRNGESATAELSPSIPTRIGSRVRWRHASPPASPYSVRSRP